MAVTTTGSLVLGCVPGLRPHLVGSPAGLEVYYVYGDPDAKLTSVTSSGIAIDVTNGNVYYAKTTGGSTWYNLGSVSD